MDELLKFLANAEFEKADKFLDENEEQIDRNFHDNNGNTLMHLAIFGLKIKLQDIWKGYTKRSYPMSALDMPRLASTACADSLYKFVDRLLTFGFSYNEANRVGIMPIYLLKGFYITYCEPSIADIQREIMTKFENIGQQVFDGRKYVSGFYLFRGSKKSEKSFLIPDFSQTLNQRDELPLTLHQRFELLERYYQKNGLQASNLVFVSIGFIVAQGKERRKVFITIPIMDQASLVVKQDGSFIHSEVAFYRYICNAQMITQLVKLLEDQNVGVAIKKVYAVVLDLFSSREVCRECGSLLHSLQSKYEPGSFLQLLESALSQKGYRLPKGPVDKPKLPLIVRAAGFEDASAYGDHDIHYPLPSVSEHFNGNIKNHGKNVIFHIAPKNNENVYSYLAQLSNSELAPAYDARPIYFLRPESMLALPMLTAFANSSADSKPRNPQIQAELKVKGELMLQYHTQKKFHQIGSFNELKEIAKTVLETTKLEGKTASMVLYYLYNIRNPQTDIAEICPTINNKPKNNKPNNTNESKINVVFSIKDAAQKISNLP